MRPVDRRRRGFLGLFAAPMAGCGGGSDAGPGFAVDVRAPNPLTPPAAPTPDDGRRCIPVTLQLHGPVARQAAMQYVTPREWSFPGSALTAATKLMRFDLGMARIVWAQWRMVWTAPNTEHVARLVHADDGPQNVTAIAEIRARGRGLDLPDNQAINITTAMEELRLGRVYKNVGFQLFGDGSTEFAVWESRIEMMMEVTP